MLLASHLSQLNQPPMAPKLSPSRMLTQVNVLQGTKMGHEDFIQELSSDERLEKAHLRSDDQTFKSDGDASSKVSVPILEEITNQNSSKKTCTNLNSSQKSSSKKEMTPKVPPKVHVESIASRLGKQKIEIKKPPMIKVSAILEQRLPHPKKTVVLKDRRLNDFMTIPIYSPQEPSSPVSMFSPRTTTVGSARPSVFNGSGMGPISFRDSLHES